MLFCTQNSAVTRKEHKKKACPANKPDRQSFSKIRAFPINFATFLCRGKTFYKKFLPLHPFTKIFKINFPRTSRNHIINKTVIDNIDNVFACRGLGAFLHIVGMAQPYNACNMLKSSLLSLLSISLSFVNSGHKRNDFVTFGSEKSSPKGLLDFLRGIIPPKKTNCKYFRKYAKKSIALLIQLCIAVTAILVSAVTGFAVPFLGCFIILSCALSFFIHHA